MRLNRISDSFLRQTSNVNLEDSGPVGAMRAFPPSRSRQNPRGLQPHLAQRTPPNYTFTLRQISGEIRVSQYVSSTSNSCINFTTPKSITRNMHRSQARRTGGIDTKTKPAEIEKVIDSPRNKRSVTSRDMISVNILGTVCLHPIVRRDTVKDSNSVSSSRGGSIWNNTSFFDCFIRRQQYDTLGRVDLRSFAWRYVENFCIE